MIVNIEGFAERFNLSSEIHLQSLSNRTLGKLAEISLVS